MATRLSTAEILAAARAAGKNRGAPISHGQSVVADPVGEVSAATAPANGQLAAAAETSQASVTNPVAGESIPADPVDNKPVPASLSVILGKVRREREAEASTVDQPPSIAAVLQRVREAAGANSVVSTNQPAASRPASIAAILDQVRGAGGAAPSEPSVPRPKQAAKAASPARQSQKRPSTAEILAAARARSAAGSTGEATAAVERPKRPKPTARPSSPVVATPASGGTVADDGAIRPKSVAEILAAVRRAAQAAEVAALPELSVMIAELRRQDAKEPGAASRSGTPADGWASRLLRWISDHGRTHRGASI